MLLYITLILTIGINIKYVNGNCSPCPPPPKHYEEFNCTGVLLAMGQCCSVKYICPNVNELDPNKCHYDGNAFNKGEKVPKNELPLCYKSCTCASNVGENTDAEFKCAVREPEPLNPSGKNCVRQYSLNECHSVNEVCGKENIQKLSKCHWRGKEFYEGERFSTESDPCYSCICDKDFDNTTYISDNIKSCRKIQCGLQLNNLNEVKRRCAPIYLGEKSCCPIGWKCPEEEVNSLVDVAPEYSSMYCYFGDLVLDTWKKLETNDKCLECTCSLPPTVTCIRKPNCIN